MFAVVVGIACSIAEHVRPARAIDYRRVVARDLGSFAIVFVMYILAVVPASSWLVRHAQPQLPAHWPIAKWPLAARLVLYYLAADLGSYLMHLLMHTSWGWRLHKWHHAPHYMYWFAGARATVQQMVLFMIPPILATPIIGAAPIWVYWAIPAEVILRNDWMHMNVAWRSRRLEWLFVTPRYHRVHHSADLRRHLGNYGSLFTLWDRFFGTRIDPESIKKPLKFGTGEKDNPVRLVVGL